MEGGCLCGALRFRIDAPPLNSGYCHCRFCQRNSGAPVVAFVEVPVASFAYINGTPGVFRSSAWGQREFCTACGSFLVYRDQDAPATVSINTASLDDPAPFAPTHHIFASRRIAWFNTADECTSFPVEEGKAALSMRLTARWAERAKAAFRARPGHGLFGIVQGSVYPDLRAESAAGLVRLGFDGYAIGGLAVGEGQAAMFETLDRTVPLLPADRPRYLMGVGKPPDIVGAVRRGIDMFDCVLPTRSGRTGQAFTRRAVLNVFNARHRDDPRPLDADCPCPTCTDYSRAYLHHLFKAKEMLGPILLSRHNLHHYQQLMAGLRQAIEDGRLENFIADFERQEAQGDIPAL